MQTTRYPLLAIAAAAFALIGAALYLQHVEQLYPCPLCILQRYLFIAIGVFALAGAIMKKPLAPTALACASALGGLGVVGRHLWVIAHPEVSCGADPLAVAINSLPTATFMPWLFNADGLCGDPTGDILGLSVPQWSAVWFVIFTVALGALLVRARRR